MNKLIKAIVLSCAVTFTGIAPVLAGNASATYYSNSFNGRRMSNGQRFSQNSNTVATNRYKLGTRVRICYRKRCVIGVVRDRCNCSVDLSKGLFKQLAPLKKGRIPVTVKKY